MRSLARLRSLSLAGLLALAVTAAAGPALAQEAVAPVPAEASEPSPPPGFERVTGPAAAQASVEAPPLVVAAYLFIWGAILAYLVVLWQRQRRISAELEGLARRLRQAVE